jgi:sugar lactone lactonase YvrE
MTRRIMVTCLAALALALPAPVRAEHTRYWRQSDSPEFDKGTAKGVAIRSDGKLVPAPRFTSFADPNLAYLWQLRVDSRGRLYAAGGSDAKVLRFDDSGKSVAVFESTELAAQTIAFDARDNLYVGTSPDGKVYKVTPDGQKSVFFEPKTKYIWALAVDPQGVLYVGTGDKGEVFAVNLDGKGQLLYQSDERHARSLAFDSKGNLLVGTDPNGLILRIEIVRKTAQAVPEAGATFVVHETNKKEVTSLLVDPSGNVYASSIGEKQRAPGATPATPAVPQPQMPATINLSGGASAQIQTTLAATSFSFPLSTTGGSEVVKISPDNSPEVVWTSHEDLVFSLSLSSAGKILLGTGNKGTIIELEGQNVHSSIARTASAQVTSMVAGPGGKVFAATANPGKIFSLGPEFDTEGSFESETFDAKIFSHWGRLTWWGENGATQGKVAFYVRSGNTSSPEKNWSPWAGPFKSAAGETVSCPPARFAQWKVVFLDTDHGGAPSVSWVSLAYQPKNVAPAIDDVVVQEPGVRVQGFSQPTGGATAPSPVQLRMPQRAGPNFPSLAAISMNPEGASRAARIDVPPQGFEDKGFQSVLWSAHDDNEDELVFSVFYRGEGEESWRLLKDKLSQRFYSWDTTTMPDGAYYLKITASDSPSNPAGQALARERETERFVIANTPPRIENLQTRANSPDEAAVTVSFDAVSSSAAVARAQYSLDAGDWQIIFPAGLLSDAPKESYQFQVSGLFRGEHTIAVQVIDRFQNTSAAKATFETSGRAAK